MFVKDQMEDKMPDPAMQIASFVGMKAFDAIANSVYTNSPVSTPGWRPPNAVAALFATVIRGAAGAVEKEWKENVTDKLELIDGKLAVISDQVGTISRGIGRLIGAMKLMDVKLDEILQGATAWEYIQSIQGDYGEYASITQELRKTLNGITLAEFQRDPTGHQKRLRTFFETLIKIEGRDINKQIQTIVTALTKSTTKGRPNLLRNFLKGCKIKHENTDLPKDWSPIEAEQWGPGWRMQRALELYEAYEVYASDVLFVLHQAYLMYEHAVAFFELGGGQPNPALPANSVQLAAIKKRQLKEVLNTYNSELEWFVLQVCRPFLNGVNPAFLDALPEPKEIFKRADRFTSLMLNEPYGIRGRMITLGSATSIAREGHLVLTPSGQPSGSASTKICAPIATDRVDVGEANEKLDWWLSRQRNRVYDEVHFSDTWVVYRYHVPDAVPGNYDIGNTPLPYTPAPFTVAQFNVKRFEPSTPSDTAADGEVVSFGSFAEVERAGGSFALLSGDWDCTRFYPEDKNYWSGRAWIYGGSQPFTFDLNESNWLLGGRLHKDAPPAPQGLGEHRVAWSDVVSRPSAVNNGQRTIATLQHPRIAVALKGEVHPDTSQVAYGGRDGTHVRYERTVTVQSKKKIRFAEQAGLSLKMKFQPFAREWGNLPVRNRYWRDDYLAVMSYDNAPNVPEHDVFYYVHLLAGFTSQGLMKRDLDKSEDGHYHKIIDDFYENIGPRRASKTRSMGLDQKDWPKPVRIRTFQNEELHFRLQARMAFRAESASGFSTSWLELFVGGELKEASLEYVSQ